MSIRNIALYMIIFSPVMLIGCGKSEPLSKIITTTNEHLVVVDPHSIRRNDGKSLIRMGFYSLEHLAGIESNDPNALPNPVVIQNLVVSFDCKQRKNELLELTWHYSKGQVQNLPKRGPETVLPNTAMEAAMTYACMSSFRRWFTDLF